jgi:hypothetical protein
MSAERYQSARDRRAAERGLRPSSAAVCPRVVAGKHCRVNGVDLCVCQRHHHLLDHGRIWLNRAGQYVLTGEPYELTPDALQEFAADLDGLSLTVAVSGRSMWNPGDCLLVTIRRADPDEAMVCDGCHANLGELHTTGHRGACVSNGRHLCPHPRSPWGCDIRDRVPTTTKEITR